MASAIEAASQFFTEAGKVRTELLEQRQALITKLEEIDMALSMLPGFAEEPAPVSLNEWRYRRKAMVSVPIGRHGIPLNSRDIINLASKFYSVSPARLTGNERYASISRARHVAMYLARKYTGESFPDIGRAFSNKDHTTVMNGVQRVERQIEHDAELRAELAEIEKAIVAARPQFTPTTVAGQSD